MRKSLLPPYRILSGRALLIAPAIVPLMAGLGDLIMQPSMLCIYGIPVSVLVGGAISYTATFLLGLPGLWLLSRWLKPTFFRTAILGAILGNVIWLPFAVILWQVSGPDFGPPQEPILPFLWGQLDGWIARMFILSGFITASLYWLIAPPIAAVTAHCQPDISHPPGEAAND